MTGFGRLKGKRVVITGAAHGIGRATAQLFADEQARLVVTDIDKSGIQQLADELTARKAEVVVAVGDVSKADDARRMISSAVDRFGGLDVLVANAGIIPLGNILQMGAEEFDQVMAVDAKGMFLVCKYAIEVMLGQGHGSIVCLSSISGVVGLQSQAAYGPAKFAASGITKHLAVEWAAKGIRVNAVAPGTILTEAVSQFPSADLERLRASHPMMRLGQPSEVASAILFLASDDAAFITGVILPVDGGYLAQ